MKKVMVIGAIAACLGLAACNTPQDRALGGAAIGGVSGAAIGGLATGTGGGAAVGGLIGAAGGAIIGAATAPQPQRCYYSRYYGRTVCR
jgi:osmotically inducible lipoprotein OsmB